MLFYSDPLILAATAQVALSPHTFRNYFGLGARPRASNWQGAWPYWPPKEGHFAFIGPEEEIPRTLIDAGYLGGGRLGGGGVLVALLGSYLGHHQGKLLLGLLVLVVGNEEADGGTVRAGDDLVELVSGAIDKINGLVVLVRGD